MAERNAAVDPAVDELRRKARRRLVGAIVLALAAAVILPMLLEKEPRPLGEDVAVKIPAVDDSKFVNRLSPPVEAGKAAGPTGAAGSAASPPNVPAASPPSAAGGSESAAPAPPSAGAAASSTTGSAVGTSGAPKPAGDSGAEPRKGAPVEGKPDVAASATGETHTVAKADVSAEAKPEAKAAGSSTSGAAKARTEGYVVQLAAFSDDKGANALASKLKRNGYAAYTETVQTSRGTLFRVRVGGYGSREAASDARARLKTEGYSGIVAPAR